MTSLLNINKNHFNSFISSLPSSNNMIYNMNKMIHNNSVNTKFALWSVMVGVSLPIIFYAGKKIYKFVNEVDNSKKDLYEYKYILELDEMIQDRIDIIENPELVDKKTIKVGSKLFDFDFWKLLSRCKRKKIIRSELDYGELPIIKEPYSIMNDTSNNEVFDYDNKYIDDESPLGIIIMKYSPDTESFWWYADNKNIPYKYLETVARKYVITYKKLDIFVDIRSELKNGIEKAKLMKENNEKEKENENKNENEDTKKNIYAKFKTYNQKSSKLQPSRGSSKIQIIKEKANRYSYRGKLNEFENLNNNENDENYENDENKSDNNLINKCKMTYDEWLKSNINMNNN